MRSILPLLALSSAASAACPYMMGAIDTAQIPAGHHHIKRDLDLAARQTTPSSVPSGEQSTVDFLDQFIVNDTDQILTSDVGGPISDQTSLKAGQRGPTLLEDFIFRQKIQHFDHERVRPLIPPQGWGVSMSERMELMFAFPCDTGTRTRGTCSWCW
jgi:catalase